MGIADDHRYTQYMTKAEKRGRKIAALWSSQPTGVAIQGDGARQPVLLERLRDRLQSRFCRKIGADRARDEHGGSLIDDVEGLDHMLLFALRVGWNSRGILKVKLPMLHRLGTLDGVGCMRLTSNDTSVLSQEPMNGARRTWQAESGLLEVLIARQIVQDGLGTRCPASPFRRLVTDFQQSIHHLLLQSRGPMVRGTTEAVQDLLISGRSTLEAFLPFVHPAQGHPCCLGQLCSRPSRIQLEQAA